MSFIYVTQQENESVFFAYDIPYNYSQNLRVFMNSIRFQKQFADKLRI